ncbi:MAG: hypothetical protein QG632_846 [Candidatus Dependentiae bacterium]|nr:hypothetical protein [Candidatus Dependentiae bacterium]MDQ5951008.1 hypothetical protein [Patescibacteria group bacterium]
MLYIRPRKVVIALFGLAFLLLLGGFTSAHAQGVIPKGTFNICVVTPQEEPVVGHEFSIRTDADNDVVTGFTADDGCRAGEIIAGPALFEIGTCLVEEQVIPENGSVFVRFTYPVQCTFMPIISR